MFTLLFALSCSSLGSKPAPARAPLPDVPFKAAAKPGTYTNVLVLLLDDVATDRIGVYAEHPQPAKTPTIDALAAEGIRFTEAYANPVCSPSRASLLTGRHAVRTGIGFNVRPDSNKPMPLDEALLPELLAASPKPYTSVGMGKWHLEARSKQSIAAPKAQGFARYEGAIGNLVKPDHYNDYTWYDADGGIHEHESTYLTTREIDTLLARVEDTPEPWLIWGAMHAPHGPWTAPPAELLSGPLPADPTTPDLYDAMLEAADHELARLLAEVDRTNTLIVLIGDNGTPKDAVREPLLSKHGKGSTFEAGVRVPWIVVGPGVPAGQVSDALVSIVDLFPTLAEVAGVDPVRDGVVIDGVSLWPVLSGQSKTVRSHAYSEKVYDRNDRASVRMIRDERYKLMERGEGLSLFDLQDRDNDGPDRVKKGLGPEEQQAYDALVKELKATKATF